MNFFVASAHWLAQLEPLDDLMMTDSAADLHWDAQERLPHLQGSELEASEGEEIVMCDVMDEILR